MSKLYNAKDFSSFIVICNHRVRISSIPPKKTVPIKVVAATNQVAKLSPELKSRFSVCNLKPYDAVGYRTVVKGVLLRREGANSELAEEIAQKLEGKSQDARDAVRVARLSPQLGTEKAIGLLLS